MRKLTLFVAVLAAACSPEFVDAPYEKLSIQLRGPRVTLGTDADPFAASKTLEATLRFYEDAAGTKPYGADLDRAELADEVKDFKPEVTVSGLDPASKTLDVFGSTPFPLPQLSGAPGPVFVRAEVVGRNAAGDAVARARCETVELKPSVKGTKTCKAFFGLVGRWNPIDPPLKARRRFAASTAGAKVVVVGGVDADPIAPIAPLGSAEVYDHVEGTWSEKQATPRFDLRATATAGGHVVLTGGRTTMDAYSSTVEYFDGTSIKTGTQLGALRAQHAAALVTGNTIVVLGGWTTPEVRAPAAEFVKFIGGSYKPEPLNAPMASSQRTDACAAHLADKVAVLCGGGAKDCETFDGTSFRKIGEVSFTGGLGATRCAVAGDTAVFVGGVTSADERKFVLVRKDAVEEVEHSDASLALVDHGIAAANGKVVVAGGRSVGTTQARKATVVIDAAGNVTAAGEMLAARAEFDLAGLPDGTILATGGVGVVTPSAELFVVP